MEETVPAAQMTNVHSGAEGLSDDPLPVDDAPTEPAFVKNARKVWRAKHPGKYTSPGVTPWARKIILRAIFAIMLKQGFQDRLTQGEWIEKVHKILEEERSKRGNTGNPVPSKDAIKNGVKLTRLVLAIASSGKPLDAEQQRWLQKHSSALVKKHIARVRDTLSAAIDATEKRSTSVCPLPVNAVDLEARGFSNSLARESLALLAAFEREIRDIMPDLPADKSLFDFIPR